MAGQMYAKCPCFGAFYFNGDIMHSTRIHEYEDKKAIKATLNGDFSVTDSCCCPPESGNVVCELPAQGVQRPPRTTNACPFCGEKGKSVQGQTVKALILVSLSEVQDVEYQFCKTQNCPVVYFSPDGEQTFRVEQVRERVYQKEPNSDDVFVCYCFRFTVGELRAAPPESLKAVLDSINTGINSGQCACDLRNPQGSCCLGNVRELMKRLNMATVEKAKPG